MAAIMDKETKMVTVARHEVRSTFAVGPCPELDFDGVF